MFLYVKDGERVGRLTLPCVPWLPIASSPNPFPFCIRMFGGNGLRRWGVWWLCRGLACLKLFPALDASTRCCIAHLL